MQQHKNRLRHIYIRYNIAKRTKRSISERVESVHLKYPVRYILKGEIPHSGKYSTTRQQPTDSLEATGADPVFAFLLRPLKKEKPFQWQRHVWLISHHAILFWIPVMTEQSLPIIMHPVRVHIKDVLIQNSSPALRLPREYRTGIQVF